jgi:hypothetical protein
MHEQVTLDVILITDSISVIDCDTVHVDRKISDHDGTYVSVEYACICSVIKSIMYII